MPGTADAAPVATHSSAAIAVPGMMPYAALVGTPSPTAIAVAAIGGEQVEDKAAADLDTINRQRDILAEIDAMYEEAAIDIFRDDQREAIEFAEEVSDEAPEVNLDCTRFFLCIGVFCLCPMASWFKIISHVIRLLL